MSYPIVIQHGLGLALKVYVRLAADVYRDPLDRPAGEYVRVIARAVVGDRFAAVAADAQTLTSHREHARLGLDPAFAEADTGLI
jgi:hypothetical protein